MVYAHRGGSALRPENTLTAFDHGLALGADGLELDVHLSRDGVVVVHHDPLLDRTTDASGPIRMRSAAELSRVDAGYRFSPAADLPPEGGSYGDSVLPPEGGSYGEPGASHGDPVASHADPVASGFSRKHTRYPYRGQGIGVPTLREVLARYPVPMIIELKTPDPALARAAVDEVRAAGAIDRVAMGSFYGRAVQAARACEPRLATGSAREETRWALYRSWVRWPLGRPAYREFQVPERSGRTVIVTPAFVAHAHRAGLPVKVWTVDERADIDRLLDWGVDAIITDRPDVAADALRARAG